MTVWNISKLWTPATSARAQRTAAAANARLPASPHARPAAVSQTRSAKALRKASNCTEQNATSVAFFQNVKKVLLGLFWVYRFCLKHMCVSGRQNLQSTKTSRFSSVLTHTPQGGFSCSFGTIHLLSSEPDLKSRVATLDNPEESIDCSGAVRR